MGPRRSENSALVVKGKDRMGLGPGVKTSATSLRTHSKMLMQRNVFRQQ